MKKITKLIIASVLLFTCTIPVFSVGKQEVDAAQSISIYVHGKYQSFDQQPVVEKGRTLIPIRGVSEALDATVKWNQKTKTVTILKDKKKIELKIGSKKVKINGNTNWIDVPAKLIHNRTMVPLRFVSEALGSNIQWNQKFKTVFIDTTKEDVDAIIKRNEEMLKLIEEKQREIEEKQVEPVAIEVDSKPADGCLFCF